MKGFDPLQMLSTVYTVFTHTLGSHTHYKKRKRKIRYDNLFFLLCFNSSKKQAIFNFFYKLYKIHHFLSKFNVINLSLNDLNIQVDCT